MARATDEARYTCDTCSAESAVPNIWMSCRKYRGAALAEPRFTVSVPFEAGHAPPLDPYAHVVEV